MCRHKHAPSGVLCYRVAKENQARILIDVAQRLTQSTSLLHSWLPPLLRGTAIHGDAKPCLRHATEIRRNYEICAFDTCQSLDRKVMHCYWMDFWFRFRVCVFSFTDNLENLQPLVQERLENWLRVLKEVIGKHQILNSVDILGAAGAVIAKVKGQSEGRLYHKALLSLFILVHSRAF